MIATNKMFNISFGFLKIRSENRLKFQKTRKIKNRDNRGNRNGHMTKIFEIILNND